MIKLYPKSSTTCRVDLPCQTEGLSYLPLLKYTSTESYKYSNTLKTKTILNFKLLTFLEEIPPMRWTRTYWL